MPELGTRAGISHSGIKWQHISYLFFTAFIYLNYLMFLFLYEFIRLYTSSLKETLSCFARKKKQNKKHADWRANSEWSCSHFNEDSKSQVKWNQAVKLFMLAQWTKSNKAAPVGLYPYIYSSRKSQKRKQIAEKERRERKNKNGADTGAQIKRASVCQCTCTAQPPHTHAHLFGSTWTHVV